MDELIWISTAPGHASNMRWLRHDVAERGRDAFQPILDRIKTGQPLGLDDFPKMIYGAPEAGEKDYRLPDLFYGYGYWVVSKAASDVLVQFDLGDNALVPVGVFRKDRTTPVGEGWLCLNLGNTKDALLPAESPRMMNGYIRDGQKGWRPPFVTKDGDIAVSRSALAGRDLWIDLQAGDSIFLSGPLGRALRKGKADKGWFLSKCRVL